MFRHSGIVASLAIALAMSVEVARGLTCASWGVTELPEEAAQSMLAGGLAQYCETAASTNCVVCQPLSACNLQKGGCERVGGVNGCQTAGPKKICRTTIKYYSYCLNNTGPLSCGPSMVYPDCVIEVSGGQIISCTLPDPNVCTNGGTAQCQDCTDVYP